MGWSSVTKTQRISNTLVYHTYDGTADASDLAAAAVADFSAINPGGGYTAFRIEWMKVYCSGIGVLLAFDATTDTHILVCGDNQVVEYPPRAFEKKEIVSGDGNFITDPKTTGYTGDIVATTTGGGAGDRLRIEMVLAPIP